MKVNTYLIVIRYLRSRTSDRRSYVTLGCERGGANKPRTKLRVDDEEEEVPIKRRSPYETKKCGCPFKLKGEQIATFVCHGEDEMDSVSWDKSCGLVFSEKSTIGLLCKLCQLFTIYTTSGVGDMQVALNNYNKLVPRILWIHSVAISRYA
ncbi:hypothetical protein M9H77_16037 [Catharanthus roseus]|uniref:Uncharacterized protein n=1 Tax=Catharanthus roseus TaxID=4058 RepID=A0ACC0B016_CATRO|nr:hypothetical protein M9H77_16037 [Catharanthus roseus]